MAQFLLWQSSSLQRVLMVSAGRLLQKGFSSKVVTQNQSFWWNESHHFMQQVRSHEYTTDIDTMKDTIQPRHWQTAQ